MEIQSEKRALATVMADLSGREMTRVYLVKASTQISSMREVLFADLIGPKRSMCSRWLGAVGGEIRVRPAAGVGWVV